MIKVELFLNNRIYGEDWIMSALVADKYLGNFRSGAKTYYLNSSRNRNPFPGDRNFIIEFKKNKISDNTLDSIRKMWF
ncbi:MAG: hypothetical protein E6767_17605 [Dysgonomonas sp.]|nr:hypothetical protein [Dysgonomonas sp.]